MCIRDSGYIVEIHVKAGDRYDGKAAAVTMSAEDTDPVLRADTSSSERRIEEGTQITIEPVSYTQLDVYKRQPSIWIPIAISSAFLRSRRASCW